jgi:hypothetical protein
MKDTREPPLVRTSERNDHAKCPLLWAWRWLDGWSPVRETTWAIFGKAWHVAMEVYYPIGRKRGSVADCIDAFLAALDDEGRKVGVDIDDLEDEHRELQEARGKKVLLVPARELGPLMMQEYDKEYRQKDRKWEVVHTEQTFQIDVPDPRDKRKVLLVLAGTWDALMWDRETKSYELWDHKSAKTIPSWGYLDLDNQAGTYPWVAKEVLVHKGILTKNGTVSAKQPAKRFERYYSARTPQQIVSQAHRVQDQGIVMEGMRNGTLPIYKTPNHECERCVFFDPCTLDEQGDDYEFYLEEMYKHRDPYRDHREEMARNGIEIKRGD